MINVRIAELKSRLSEYLRRVRAGRSLVVMDRDTPIARVVPYAGEGDLLRIRPPLPGSGGPGRVPLPPPLRQQKTRDVVSLLLEERQGSR